ncbi:MAG: hypothetical protein HYR85_01035 [Planctomycetes bacterium]|nr:hypothetical protein [Planctomycetota bacterium]
MNAGVVVDLPRIATPSPKRIYTIHQGVVYRAVPTVPGISFHAFPELAEDFRRLPPTVRQAVLSLADKLGCLAQVRRWVNS